ncbi:MAG TPA: hypothetical protein VL171_16910 [Verrucomicrobiae bacterium]|nr:hypothetical protein [Verrucomicrobiae bacterium]
MKHSAILAVLTLAFVGSAPLAARAEDQSLPTFRSFAGAFLAGDQHNFFVESELELPLLHEGPSTLYYRHQESTPFLDLDRGVQAEQLYEREEAQVDFVLSPYVRLIFLGGYESVKHEDRAGSLSAYALGGGFGSPLTADDQRLHWYALGGGYVQRSTTDSDWWTDLFGSYRLYDFLRDEYFGSKYRASLNVAGRLESSSHGGRFQGLYRVGPELQMLTANGNRANLSLDWYRNDNNPFYGSNENGLLLGIDITSSRDDSYVFDARGQREPGWFPLIWGDYDLGFGGSKRTQRFSMNVEVLDFDIAQQRFTGFVWYETHQEHRANDFQNISYTVTLGFQSVVGLQSVLSQGEPLVAGFDFLHRSDHALSPPRERVAAEGKPTSKGPLLQNGSDNLLPRLRLQTRGWDLPYRDPHIYDHETRWLSYFDWRVTAGMTDNSSRSRGRFAGQVGLNWDVATIQGYVAYIQGVGSVGNETPDWRGEFGVRRPAFKLFGRAEKYGINRELARGEIFVLGAGVNL